MKKNTKGFTLIELLAVIVILAIIALIAVPVIMNILTESRKSAAADTAYSILNAAELYYAEQLLEHPTEAFTSKTFQLPAEANVEGGLQLKGTVPEGGSVTVDKNGKATITTALSINNLSCNHSATNPNEIECE